MGYPMTWRRVVDRNRLRDEVGNWTVTMPSSVDNEAHAGAIYDAARENVQNMQGRVNQLRADLLRFESDALDENAVVLHIASLTGLHTDQVAAVLQALFHDSY